MGTMASKLEQQPDNKSKIENNVEATSFTSTDYHPATMMSATVVCALLAASILQHTSYSSTMAVATGRQGLPSPSYPGVWETEHSEIVLLASH